MSVNLLCFGKKILSTYIRKYIVKNIHATLKTFTMKKRWNIPPTDPSVVNQLQEALKIDPVFCQMLVQRGISTFDEARHFFRPSLDHLYDPFLMKDMDKAIARLELAFQQKEKILLYGDYDVDGTTSVALMYSFLEKYYDQLDFYVPDRYKEGYGISFAGIDYAKQNSMTLIIAMDCGIKAIEKVAYAKAKGIDFIICDHHLPEEILPDAIAVLDPKRKDCEYPYKELSGCGIAFKFAQAFIEKKKFNPAHLYDLLDFVVISISCDIVPIDGENRVLAFFGLEKLNTTKREGLKALMEMSKRAAPLSVSDVVFGIGPIINAAGRLEHAKEAVNLMLSKEKAVAMENARTLQNRNDLRKQFDKQIFDEAKDFIDTHFDLENKKSIVLYNPTWHKGVIGIVASRIVETYHRPTIILTESNGVATGSARSIPGFNIHEAIYDCKDFLTNFGGHAFAAGMTLDIEKIKDFEITFEKIVSKNIGTEPLTPEINVTAMLPFNSISPKFWRILKQFAPFGPKNRNPVFVSRNIRDTGFSRLLKNSHLKLSVKQGESVTLAGIAFGKGDLFADIQNNDFHICYTLNENSWNGKTALQLNVKDIKIEGE